MRSSPPRHSWVSTRRNDHPWRGQCRSSRTCYRRQHFQPAIPAAIGSRHSRPRHGRNNPGAISMVSTRTWTRSWRSERTQARDSCGDRSEDCAQAHFWSALQGPAGGQPRAAATDSVTIRARRKNLGAMGDDARLSPRRRAGRKQNHDPFARAPTRAGKEHAASLSGHFTAGRWPGRPRSCRRNGRHRCKWTKARQDKRMAEGLRRRPSNQI